MSHFIFSKRAHPARDWKGFNRKPAPRPPPGPSPFARKWGMTLFPDDLECLPHPQRRTDSGRRNRVLSENHAFQLAVVAIRLQRRERLDAIDHTALLIGGGDRTASAGLHDPDGDITRAQLVNAIRVIRLDTIDHEILMETVQRQRFRQ